MSYQSVDVIEVLAWGRTVGALALDPATGFYAFEYDPDWVESGQQLAPLQMPNQPGTFVFPGLSPETFQRLPAMIADCLPDRFGNALVNAWMQDHGVRTADITALDRLAYASDRSMGTLEFRPPAASQSIEATALQLADLVTAARSAVTGDLDNAPKDALSELIQVGTSAGGARAKAVIAYNPVTGQMRTGQLDAPMGYEHWLIKLDGVGDDPTRENSTPGGGTGYGRIEYAYSLMATAAGLTMTECKLLPEGPRTHFMTRRFDRLPNGDRVHLQSLCGLAALDFNMAGAHSYAQYFNALDALGLGVDAREQAFRRMVFNVVAMNRDDHTKNLAFLLPEQGDWVLAPAYDITYAHNPAGKWTGLHQMSIEGKRDQIGLNDLYRVADKFLVPGYKAVVSEVVQAAKQWPDFAAEAGVGAGATTQIGDDLATVHLSKS